MRLINIAKNKNFSQLNYSDRQINLLLIKYSPLNNVVQMLRKHRPKQ